MAIPLALGFHPLLPPHVQTDRIEGCGAEEFGPSYFFFKGRVSK